MSLSAHGILIWHATPYHVVFKVLGLTMVQSHLTPVIIRRISSIILLIWIRPGTTGNYGSSEAKKKATL